MTIPPPTTSARAERMPGGAFCDCGLVEFLVPGPAYVLVGGVEHTPVACSDPSPVAAPEARGLLRCFCGEPHGAGHTHDVTEIEWLRAERERLEADRQHAWQVVRDEEAEVRRLRAAWWACAWHWAMCRPMTDRRALRAMVRRTLALRRAKETR